MSNLADLLRFYGEVAWTRNEISGRMEPSAELLADRGAMARKHARPAESGVPPREIVEANYVISAAEIAEALRDILFAINMPPCEARNLKLGSACITLQNAEYRIRTVTKS